MVNIRMTERLSTSMILRQRSMPPTTTNHKASNEPEHAQRNLDQDTYQDANTFYDDFQLVIPSCVHFNTIIYIAGQDPANAFNEKWRAFTLLLTSPEQAMRKMRMRGTRTSSRVLKRNSLAFGKQSTR
jgi:hypothetical protein